MHSTTILEAPPLFFFLPKTSFLHLALKLWPFSFTLELLEKEVCTVINSQAHCLSILHPCFMILPLQPSFLVLLHAQICLIGVPVEFITLLNVVLTHF